MIAEANEYMAQADPLLGRVIGDRYRLTRAIGKGGFGAVYEAEHVSLDRHFAVKILRRHLDADPSFVQRFHREARLTSGLEHAHIIQVTDFGHDERLGTYFVMELLRGEDLQERIRRVGPMTSKTAVGVMRQIVDAFVYAHGKGVIHRDVKSANVFLVSDDTRTDFVKVLDFGIARLSDPTAGEAETRLTRTGNVMGSPAYMAPEQALGLAVDHRTDIYSLGIVFYEMVTGRVPFTATSAFEIISKQIREAPVSPSEIRPDLNVHPCLELVILRCLRKKMGGRFQHTQELADALVQAEDQIRSGGETPAQVMGTLSQLRLAMISDGSLLAESSEQDRRRIVGGDGYSEVRDELERKGNRTVLALVASLVVLGLALFAGIWIMKKGDTIVDPPPVAPGPVRTAVAETSAPVAPPVTIAPPVTTTPPVTATPLPAQPLQAVVATDPPGGVFWWKGEEGNPKKTPGILAINAADEGRVLVLSKPGFVRKEVPVNLDRVRADGRVIVPLERVRPKEPERKADSVLPKPEPAPKKKSITVDDDPLGGYRE